MPLHACRNCRQFVDRGPVRCMVPEAPRVLDPHAANRCPTFEFAFAGEGNGTLQAAVAKEPMDHRSARQRWDQLFGG